MKFRSTNKLRIAGKTASAIALLNLITGSVLVGTTFVPENVDTTPGKTVYMVGNSHTASVRNELAGLAGAAGHLDFSFGTHALAGAPIWYLAEPGRGDESLEHLRNHSFDALTLQSYIVTNEKEIMANIQYADAALEGNPDIKIMMYTVWGNPGEESLGRSEEWTETVAQRIREKHPEANVVVIPTNLIINKIGEMANAGLIPGLNGRRDLFGDPGHMGNIGAYVIATTMYAMLYETSPIGLPTEVLTVRRGIPQPKSEGGIAFELPLETAEAIQRVIWDILAEYPHDGVDTGLVVNSERMPVGLVGRAYDQPLPIINADSEPQWSIVEGDLPAGLQLQNGRIAGTPAEETEATFTVRAKAGGETAQREMTLVTARERPLKIVLPEKVKLAADEHVMTYLRAENSVGRVSWSLVEGELPRGLLLRESGLMMGTPGERGEFTITLQAQDSHPDKPRTTRETLTMRVGPPSQGSILVSKTTEDWSLDGEFSESFWDFSEEITTADGKPIATFAVHWYETDDPNVPPKNRRFLLLGVKVAPADEVSVPNEWIHLYLDTMHNRELIYNEDDLHYAWSAGKSFYRPQGYKASGHFKFKPKVTEDGGWQMELGIRYKAFAGGGVHTQFGPDVSYGFDLAIGDRENAEQRAYWQGDPANDEDTSGFGSILLIEQE